MHRNVVQAELNSGPARVRVQTYTYETPSEQTRCPQQHTLTLMTSRRRNGWRGFFHRPHQPGRMFAFGDLIFVPAGLSIHGSGPGGPQNMVACSFPRGAADALRMFEEGWDDRELARCGDLRSDRIADAMRRLGEEALQPGFGSDVLVDALTTALPIDLARHFQDVVRRRAPVKGGLAPHQLRSIEEYVREWPAGGVRVGDLADLVGLSRGHFMRAFKQSVGKTVHGFVEGVRLDQAKTLLAEDDMPLKQIAARLGFANPASFSLAFRRMTGDTPGRYRGVRKGLR
ncbi:hypothetical protein ACFB49_02700 [Sphingomonas sp. DBB INV C78]|uniref:helix-turn-helix domain-containing protein n=1 Tax=Sphingomonas sp. DBB INV C78 TaxID=3349434 RepID=UPI0036D28D5F